MSYLADYLGALGDVIRALDQDQIERMADELVALRERKGRLFILGNGGSAANASHAVNDFRKLCRIEAYTPTDNVAELTARINDDGVGTAYSDWLGASHVTDEDAVLILSVGGGNATTSNNLVSAMWWAQSYYHCKLWGIVGEPGDQTLNYADLTMLVPNLSPQWKTPFVETCQAVIWHALVNHPKLKL